MNVSSTRTRLSLSEESRAKSNAARLSIIVAAILISIKVSTGWYTGSISVFASLLDSMMDIFASTINFVAVRAAARPPDEDHTYGHGKAESLAGLFQAGVILLSSGFLIVEAANRISTPRATKGELVGIAAMLLAISISFALVARLRRVARMTDSPALRSEAMHYASDIYTNLSALVALVVTLLTGWLLADPVISLVISLYIIFTAVGVARVSIGGLMDTRLPVDIDETVAAIVVAHRERGVLGYHALRTRSSGAEKFIELHLEVLRTKSFEEAHDVTVDVLRSIEAEIPRARVQIHTDPSG